MTLKEIIDSIMEAEETMAVNMGTFQVIGQRYPDRTDHVWIKRQPDDDAKRFAEDFKCVLCGAVTRKPPKHSPRVGTNPPPDSGWMADRYETLTDEERAMCPKSVP